MMLRKRPAGLLAFAGLILLLALGLCLISYGLADEIRKPEILPLLGAIATLGGCLLLAFFSIYNYRRNLLELNTLIQASRAVMAESDLTATLEQVVKGALRVLKADRGAIYFLDSPSRRLRCMCSVGLSEEYIKAVTTLYRKLPGTRILDGCPYVVIADTLQEPALQDIRSLFEKEGIRSYAVLPLVVRGQAAGVLVVYRNRPSHFDESTLRLAQAFADQAALAIGRVVELEATRKAEERYRRLFEGIPIGLYRSTPDGTLLDVNPALVDILGYPDRETLLKTRAPDLYADPGDRKRWQDLVEHHDVIHNFEVRLKRYDGTTIWVWDNARTVRDEYGQVVCYEGSIEDITRQKEAEESLQRQAFYQEVLNTLITSAATASSLSGIPEAILEPLMQAVEARIGAIWFKGQRIIKGIPPELMGKIYRTMRELSPSLEKTAVVEDWQRVPDDAPYASLKPLMQELGIRASISAPIMDGTTPIGGISLASSSPRKWYQEEIALIEVAGHQLGGVVNRMALLEKIRSQAQQIQSILDAMPQGVFLLSADRKVVLANPLAREYLRLLAQVRPGQELNELGGVAIETLMRSEPQGTWQEITVDSPTRRVFEITVRALGDVEWLFLVREVTRERMIQQRIQEQERLAAIGQLAAGIAHDFNNILTGIIGFSKLILKRADLPTDVRNEIEMVASEGERAAQLVQQILDFSRSIPAEKRPVDMLPFLKETIKFLKRTFPEDINIILEYTPGDYWVEAEVGQLQQMITNIAINARDAMPNGGVLSIRLDYLQVKPDAPPPEEELHPGDWVVLQISDTGTGIPEEVLPHIFEPFFTTKPPGRGTGLGLTQVIGIIHQLQGHIKVESEPGVGTTFTIYLPATELQSQVHPTSGQEKQEEVPRGKGETVLIVEDDPTVRQVIKAYLENLGYRVMEAADAREALERYSQDGMISVVVSDMVMPGVRGYDLLRHLRERDPNLKLILITGYPLDMTLEELKAQGISAWISKPIKVETLASKIHEALEDKEHS